MKEKDQNQRKQGPYFCLEVDLNLTPVNDNDKNGDDNDSLQMMMMVVVVVVIMMMIMLMTNISNNPHLGTGSKRV